MTRQKSVRQRLKKARDAEVERLKAEDAAYKAQKKAEKLAKKGKK